MVNSNARQDSNIDKETAFDYFRKQKAFQKIVANKSYAQIVKAARYQNQESNTCCKIVGHRTPLDKRVVNKKEVTNTYNDNLACTKAFKAPRSVVTGAGVKPRVSYTENSITLNNSFQILDTLCDMHTAYDKVEDQYALIENNNIEAHESYLNELAKMPEKYLGDTSPSLEGKSKKSFTGKKNKTGFSKGITNSPSMTKIFRRNSTLGSAKYNQSSHRTKIRPSWRV